MSKEVKPGKGFDVLKKFYSMDQRAKVQCEYIWIGGGSGLDLRSKTRTLNTRITNLNQIPMWNYDGSSTGYVCIFPLNIFF